MSVFELTPYRANSVYQTGCIRKVLDQNYHIGNNVTFLLDFSHRITPFQLLRLLLFIFLVKIRGIATIVTGDT